MNPSEQMLLFLLLTATATSGQDTARDQLQGRVLTRADQAARDATVTLVSRRLAWCPEVGAVDHVETRASERGIFHAALLPGRSYSAWATWVDEEGRSHASTISELVHADTTLRLMESDAQPVPHKLRITGLDAWDLPQPPRYQVRLDADTAWTIPLEVDDAGQVVVPCLPVGKTGYHHLEILYADGRLLYDVTLEADGKSRSVDLPKPFDVDVVVTGGERPLPGAEVRLQVSAQGWPVLGTTDKEGRCRIRMPSLLDVPEQCLVWVRAEGHADAFGGWIYGSTFAHGKETGEAPRAPVDRPPTVTLALEAPRPLTGKIVGRDGGPAVGTALVIGSQLPFHRTADSCSSMMAPTALAIADDTGTFRLPGFAPDAATVVSVLVLSDATRQALAAELADWSPPPVLFRPIPVRGDRPDDVGTIDLRDYVPVRLELLAADGGPARDTRVYVAHGASVDPELPFEPRAFTDRRGRVSLLCRRSNPLAGLLGRGGSSSTVLAWGPGVGWLAEKLVPAGDGVVQKKLMPFDVFAGRVLSSEGSPVAGAQLTLSGWGHSGAWPHHDLVDEINRDLLRGTTDAEGRFRLHFVAQPERFGTISVEARIGEARERQSFELRQPQEDAEIVLERIR